MKHSFLESLEIEAKVMELYMNNAKTAILESDATLIKQGVNENEIIIPKIEMNGLADYKHNNGYTQDGVSIHWQAVKFNYTGNWKLNIQRMDNEETLGLTLRHLIAEVVRTKTIPK